MVDLPNEVNVFTAFPTAVLAGGDEVLGATFVADLPSQEGQAMPERYGLQPVE